MDFDRYVWGFGGRADQPVLEEVEEALSVEEAVLRRHERERQAAGDEDGLAEVDEDAEGAALWAMEPGVASAVLALSANGCSVRAKDVSYDDSGSCRFAVARFYLPTGQVQAVVPALLEILERTSCGLVNS